MYFYLTIRTLPLQNEDLNRPLLPENVDDHSSKSNSFPGSVVGESSKIQTNRSYTSPRSHGIADTGGIYPAESCAIQGILNCAQTFSSLLGKSPLFSFSCLCWIAQLRYIHLLISNVNFPVTEKYYKFCRRNSCN